MFLYQYVRVTRIPGIEIELGKYWIPFEFHAYDQPPIVRSFSLSCRTIDFHQKLFSNWSWTEVSAEEVKLFFNGVVVDI